MGLVKGLTGLRPKGSAIGRITCPPYDVIKEGTQLAAILSKREESLYHITLGPEPVNALAGLKDRGLLLPDEEACYYIYEQQLAQETRTGVLAAVKVTDYCEGKVIRHEKTFDEKVKGRLELRRKTGYTFEPVFLLTKAALNKITENIKAVQQPIYEFRSDLGGASDLDGIKNRVFRVPENSAQGKAIAELVGDGPFYIADGHHRYHASLLNKQSHCLAYICEVASARILAYNRVINGKTKFADIMDQLALAPEPEFKTPAKHSFSIYSKEGIFSLKAGLVPDDVIGRLDCSILERELYPLLGLTHDLISDERYFDYYAEYELDKMKDAVDKGKYDIAVALHPVSGEELLAVADAGISNPVVVMPEKSTFFAPKILSGIFIYRHSRV